MPVGTVLSYPADVMREGGDIRLDFHHDAGYGYIWIPAGSWEAVPEPTEADRLREQLAKAEAEIQSYSQAQELWKRRVERRNENVLKLEGELQQARQRIAELEEASKPPVIHYRILEEGELLHPGDEILCQSGWINLCWPGLGNKAEKGKARRRVKESEASQTTSEPQYRMLEPGEVI